MCYTRPITILTPIRHGGGALTNTERIAEYIAGGCTGENRLGVEIEHFVLRRDRTQVTYNSGIQDILNKLSDSSLQQRGVNNHRACGSAGDKHKAVPEHRRDRRDIQKVYKAN